MARDFWVGNLAGGVLGYLALALFLGWHDALLVVVWLYIGIGFVMALIVSAGWLTEAGRSPRTPPRCPPR